MYRGRVERLTRAIPRLGLGTDLIVGHPGERDQDFEETLDLVGELPFSYLHVFSYSDRKGTEAARLGERAGATAIRERGRRLRRLGRDKSLAFRQALVGQPCQVLVLGARDRATGLLSGLTANYVEVLFEGPDSLARRFVSVAVSSATVDRTFGRLEPVPA